MATLAEIQSAYFAINRTSLDDAGAVSVLTKIAAGDFTFAGYISDLSAKAASTTGAALALLGFVMGSTPTSEHLDALKTAADAQQASYARMGAANPAMGAFEAFGKSLAGDPNSGFAAKYGVLSGADFIAETYKSIYGEAPTVGALANLTGQIAYFLDLYTKAGFDPTQAALEAKGAVLGQIIAYAFIDPVAATKSTIDNQVTTFLAKAAFGDVTVYGAPLPAPGEMPPAAPTHSTAPIDFAPNLGTAQGSSDASTAIALGGNTMLVGDDEANVLRVYSRDGGVALKEISYDSFVNLGDEADLEASARIGNTLYFAGSHSNSKSGADANSREVIFSATISGDGSTTALSFTGKYTGMEAALANWDHTGASGKGADYYGITANAAAGIPERDAGVSIEGMTFSPDNGAMWLAFRAPVTGGADLHKALIVPVTNFDAMLTASATPALGSAIELDLGGRGIRSIDKNAAGQYIILAGPAGGASADVANDFRLYSWDGAIDGNGQAIHLVERAANLDALRDGSGGSFESLVEAPDAVTDNAWVQLLQDNGDTVWSGQSQVSKDLPAGQQHFNGNWVQLGAAVAADTTAPLMVRSTPTDNATGVAGSAKVELTFNEAVHAGSGNLVLKSGSTTVATFAANDSRIAYEYNKVTIDTSALLGNDKGYSVEIASDAIVDAKGNGFAGLDAAHAIDFRTASTATTLAAGDLAFVGYNAKSNAGVQDAFAFVLLKDVTSGTAVRFTDKEWTGTAFNSGESDLLWTASSNLSAGAVVTIQPGATTPVASTGILTGSGGGLGDGGEQIFAITGTVAAPGTFVAAIGLGTAGGLVTTGADLNNTSFVPAGLTLGTNAVNTSFVNAAYTGITTGSADDLRAAIADASHWTSTNNAGSTITGDKLDLGFSSLTVDGPTTLAAGDVVFLGVNTDSTDAFAFMVTRAIGTGTQIGFTDRDYSATTMPTNESAYIWTAGQAIAAGTIITIQPDVSGANNPIASQGTTQGKGGGLSASGETVYAFQGSIAGLGNGTAGAITASAWLGGINAGGAAAGDTPAGLTLQSFALDNAFYAGSRSAVDITAFKALALDPANWTLSDTVSTVLTGNDFFL